MWLICCNQSVSSSGREPLRLQLSAVRCTLFFAGLSAASLGFTEASHACPALQPLAIAVDAPQVWRFNDWVKDQLQPVMEELHELPAPRMAFHIRGGDKLSEDVQLVRRRPLLDRSHGPQFYLEGLQMLMLWDCGLPVMAQL